MALIALLMGLLLLAGTMEHALHVRTRNRVKIRVLVNGTRGKTSVTRLMAAVLREAGYVAYAKCTGTAAAVIGPDGREALLKRRRGARLTEPIAFFRQAAKGQADAVVLECMAVRPESQAVFSRQLVKPTLILMTNAWVDHVAEMGPSEADTVRALSHSLLPRTPVLSNDTDFSLYTHALIEPGEQHVDAALMARFDYPVFAENLALVLAAAAYLGIDREVAIEGMLRARPDVGMVGPFDLPDCVVINAFAANDATSTAALLAQTERARGLAGCPITLIYNNRADREYRLRSFVPLLQHLSDRSVVLLAVGDHKEKVARYFRRRTGLAGQAATRSEVTDALRAAQGIALCLGNIKGEGLALIEALMSEGGQR